MVVVLHGADLEAGEAVHGLDRSLRAGDLTEAVLHISQAFQTIILHGVQKIGPDIAVQNQPGLLIGAVNEGDVHDFKTGDIGYDRGEGCHRHFEAALCNLLEGILFAAQLAGCADFDLHIAVRMGFHICLHGIEAHGSGITVGVLAGDLDGVGVRRESGSARQECEEHHQCQETGNRFFHVCFLLFHLFPIITWTEGMAHPRYPMR